MKTVLTTGVFDVLHPGHLRLFREITSAYPGCILIVGVNGDRRTKELKERVVFTAEDRATVLNALGIVDAVVVFEEDTPADLIRRLKPDVFVKGKDWREQHLQEEAACAEVGADIVFLGENTHSSSALKRLMF